MENSIKNKRNSIEEDIYAKELIKKVKEIETGLNYYIKHSQQLENELNLYKIMYENRVEEYLKLKQQIKESQKENEELKISNKEIDKECSRLEKKEVELINKNEHYEDLIYALETYYEITEEDLEKCMKNDR